MSTTPSSNLRSLHGKVVDRTSAPERTLAIRSRWLAHLAPSGPSAHLSSAPTTDFVLTYDVEGDELDRCAGSGWITGDTGDRFAVEQQHRPARRRFDGCTRVASERATS